MNSTLGLTGNKGMQIWELEQHKQRHVRTIKNMHGMENFHVSPVTKKPGNNAKYVIEKQFKEKKIAEVHICCKI